MIKLYKTQMLVWPIYRRVARELAGFAPVVGRSYNNQELTTLINALELCLMEQNNEDNQ